MNSERWQRVKEVIDLASEAQSFEQARAIVERACGDDSELRQEVIKLLAVEEDMGDFIEEPLWSLVQPEARERSQEMPESSFVGRRVGPYRIERTLGRGGMGTVFLAVREDDYEQQVALKVVSWHINSEQVMARFYNERQILANLRHPGIASLLDGGATREGRPYLVMEYVEGQPIDVYCREHQLSLEERLQLFRQVCQLVHFAHRNLVIHRDLKPSNILVTADGSPRLLDFGIAKLVTPDAKMLDVTAESGPVPMTPSCASPEQFLDEPITTACDVYSLGVLLFLLLTDMPPYELEGRSFAEMVRVICWQEPDAPSRTVLTAEDKEPSETETLPEGVPESQARSSSLRVVRTRAEALRLSQRLKGDLDAITLKALRKDPQDRYSSTAEFGEDVERYLSGEPVRAHQGNWLYYWRKFARRNKYRLLAAAVLGVLVTVFTALLAVQIERNAQMNHRAETLNQFLKDVFRASSPNRARGETITARDLLESGRELIGERLQDDPEYRAEVLRTLAQVAREQGNLEEARSLYQESLEIEEEVHADDHHHKMRLVIDLAAIAYDQGLFDDAEALYRQALEVHRRLHGPEDPSSDTLLNGLGATLVKLRKFNEAEEVFAESLAARRRYDPPRPHKIAFSLNSLGICFFDQGQFEKAEGYFREALEIRLESRGLENTETATSFNNLGRVLFNMGRLEEAEKHFRQALELRKLLLEEDHPDVANTKRNLALLLLEKGEAAEALDLARRATEILEALFSNQDWRTAEARSILGACLSRMGRYEEADQDLRDGYTMLRSILGEDSVNAATALERLQEHYRAWGKPEKLELFLSVASSEMESGH